MENWRRKKGRLGDGFVYSHKPVADVSAGFARIILLLVIGVLVLVGGAFAFKIGGDQRASKISVQPSDSYGVQDISLQDLIDTNSVGLSTSQSLSINGQLRANNSLVIAPTSRPTQATAGQIYYDKEGNVLAYYDGAKFVDLAGTDEVAELRSQIESVRAGIPVVPTVPTLPADVATQSGQNIFSGSNSFTGSLGAGTLSLSGAAILQSTLTVAGATTLDSVSAAGLTVSGTTALGPATASSLVLSSPLGIASGGTGVSTLTNNGVLLGQGSAPVAAVTAPAAGLCLISTAGAPSFQACPGGVAAVVDSLNGLKGDLLIQGDAQIGVSTADPTISLFINAGSIGDAQLAFDTGQSLTVSSTPQFNGVTLNNNLTLGGNSIVTSGATIGSAELEVLDGGVSESEVTGVITDVTAGNGLVGGGASGNATLNITSANGGIAVNADSIALTLQPTGDALSATTSSGSGLEVLAGGLALLQGCGDGQVLKWNETTDTWGCAVDAGSGGLGDDVSVNGAAATNANFIDTVASGTSAGVAWSLNTTPSPDDVSVTISNASATQAGVVTTGVQSFAGDKTFNNALTTTGLFTANGGVTIETGDTFSFNGEAFTDLTGTGLLLAGGALQTTLGTTIDSSEIVDGAIVAIDLGDGIITSAKITDGTIATIDIGDGQVTSVKIADGTVTGTDIADDTIALGTKTTGNYQAGTASGTGLVVTGAAGEGWTPTISLDYSGTLASNSLGVNQSSFAATGILFEGSTADGFETLFTLADPTADNTITLPNASGTICLSTGNCAGAGGGVTTAGGTTNRLAKFTASQAVNDSTITDDGSNVTTSVNLIVQGGNVTAGTNSQLGSFILTDGNGQTTTLRAGDSAGNLTFTLPTAAGSQFQCLKYDTGGQLIWDNCDGGSSGGSGVTSLNNLSGDLSIQGNAQIGVSAANPNINLSINTDSIGDSQLAFNTGQHLTTTSAPTFAGLTLGGNLTVGTNSIVTGVATISSTELDVLDGGITESEVTGVITDVTAGTGLTGGAVAGNATLNVASANGGIVVNADNIALTLQPTGDALSSTTSSGSGLEILSTGFSLIQGCADSQILKWNETTDTWGCAADAGGSGLGDDVLVNGSNADGANLINSAATGTSAGIVWNLNTTPSPDEITLTVSNASATQAGVVTTGVQSFAGDKTFNNAATITGLFTANGGVTIETGDTFTFNGEAFTDLTGTGLTISGGALQVANDAITDTQLAFNTGQHLTVTSAPTFAGLTSNGNITIGTNGIVTGGATIGSTELDVLDGGIDESEVTGVITDVTAGNGLAGGGASGNATLNVASANGGIVVNADNIALTLQPTGDALSSTTSSGSGLEILSTGLSLLQGCGDAQILKWNETTDTWGCAADAGGSGVGDDLVVNGANADGGNFINTVVNGSTAGVTWNLNTTPSPDEISITISNASATEAGVVTTGVQSFAGVKTFGGQIVANGGVSLGTQTLQGTTAVIDFTNFDVAANGNTTVGGTLTVTGTSALNGDVTVAAGKSLTITGGATGTRPSSPTEGMVYFDTTTKQLLTYANGKWQADRTTAAKIIAPSNASQAAKDSADVVLTGTADQTLINSALTAAAGGKVHILAGTVTVTGSISIPNNTMLVGAGADTLITIPNSLGSGIFVITNTDTTTGTGVVVRDLRLDGNKANQGAFSMTGIHLNSMGGGSGASARQGAEVANVQSNNFVSNGFYLNGGAHTTIIDSSAQGNGNAGFTLISSDHITLANNSASGNTAYGFYVTATNGIINGNTAEANAQGFYLDGASNNTLAGNVASSNTNRGFALVGGANDNTLTGNTANSNIAANFYLNASSTNILTGNASIGGTSGFSLNASSNGNTFSGNSATIGGTGFSLSSSSRNTFTGNTIQANTSAGMNLNSSSTNTISGNKLHDNGNTTANNAILLVNSSSNLITGNSISDTSATTTNYAIDVSNAGSNTNYLASNTLGTGTINDLGTGTVYGGQVNVSGNFIIQPAGSVELMKNTNITGTLNVTGDVDTNGSLTVGNANQFTVNNTGIVTAGAWQGTAVADAYVANDLTINGSGNVDWQALNNYPAACPAGQAITQLGDTITCAVFAAGSGSGSYIQNQNASAQTVADYWISGSGRADTSVLTPTLDTATAVALNVGTTNATQINLNKNVVVAANQSLTITGGATGTRPSSPTEGMVYFDTTTKQLLTYSNGKWQADRTSTTKTVAPSTAAQYIKDTADYVATGTNDHTVINSALTAAAGGKVYLFEGTFTVGASISVPNNTTLSGSGQGTIIQFADIDVAANMIVNTDTTSGTGVVIRDMKLDGRNDLNTVGSQQAVYFSQMGNTALGATRPGGLVSGITATRFSSDAFNLVASDGNRFVDNHVLSTAAYAIWLDTSENNTIARNVVQDSDSIAVTNASKNTVVTGNQLKRMEYHAIYVDNSDNVTITDNNVDGAVHGVMVANSARAVVSGNVVAGTQYGIRLEVTNDSLVTGNMTDNNSAGGIYLTDPGTTGNTISGNTSTGDFWGVYLDDAHNNTIDGNTFTNNGDIAILLSGANSTHVSDNRITDSGGATRNDAIIVQFTDNATISNNTITDSSATTDNYAIEITSAASDNTYLSGNTLGTGTIQNLGTGTIFGGQVNNAGNYLLQPSGSIELMKNTNVTGTLTATTLASTVATGTAPITVNSTTLVANLNTDLLDGQHGSYYQDASNINAGTLAVANGGTGAGSFTQYGILFGNGTGAFGVTAAGTTGQCLLSGNGTAAPTWGTCTPTTLQGSYDGSSPATINLADSKNFTINATEQTTDSSIVFNLQCVTCSAGGGRFAIQDAGVDIFTVNPNGDIVIGTGGNTVTFSAAGNYEPVLANNARHTKKIVLTPEYSGAVLDYASDSACTTNNSGTMTSAYDSTNRMSYYNWMSTQTGAAHCYDVIVQVPIPSDFDGWAASNPIDVRMKKDSTGTAAYGMQILRSDNSADTTFCSSGYCTTPTSGFAALGTSWGNMTTNGLSSSNYTAGDYFTIKIRMSSQSSANVSLGNITLTYKSKW